MALPKHITPFEWTLFVDRDGVINRKIDGGYVRAIHEFELLPGVLEALRKAARLFKRVVVVTNQQGIGKGLMTEDELLTLHSHMMQQVEQAGGRIDAIYFAPQLQSENSMMRKPNPGMVLKAVEDMPDIDLTKSIMIGDSIIDMEMGRRAGIYNIYITDKTTVPDALMDAVCPTLLEAINLLRNLGSDDAEH